MRDLIVQRVSGNCNYRQPKKIGALRAQKFSLQCISEKLFTASEASQNFFGAFPLQNHVFRLENYFFPLVR